MSAIVLHFPSVAVGSVDVRPVARVSDDTTAHGLRQHSIGSTFPAIVVGRGNGTYEVHLGGHSITGLSNDEAQQWAEMVAKEYRRAGWQAAVGLLLGSC